MRTAQHADRAGYERFINSLNVPLEQSDDSEVIIPKGFHHFSN